MLLPIETLQFNTRLVPDRLAMMSLRVRQAMDRKPELYELLNPVLEDVNVLGQWNEENVKVISEQLLEINHVDQDIEV